MRGLLECFRDVEIGFVKGGGFAGMPKQDEWVRAAEAVVMLKPILTEYSAQLRICQRAHGGLIRARAEQFHHGQRVFYNHDIPKEFWWAKGHQALEQDWAVGDFSTWIERGSIQLKAFGVTFARADIQKLLPPPNSVKAEAVAHTDEDDEKEARRARAVCGAVLQTSYSRPQGRQQSFLSRSCTRIARSAERNPRQSRAGQRSDGRTGVRTREGQGRPNDETKGTLHHEEERETVFQRCAGASGGDIRGGNRRAYPSRL
jgi:hypothetical protein